MRAQSLPLSLDQLLSRIEANTEQYTADVPSFVCDEQITSQEFHDGKLKHQTTTQALFRVARSASEAGALLESREIITVDGKPSQKKNVALPLTFTGGFSGALTKFLSAGHRQCFDYRPETGSSSPKNTMVFTFAANQAAGYTPACRSILAGTTGRFVIDTTAIQVIHIERTTPNLIGKDQIVTGTASIDYAPVVLGEQSFWLPITISAFTSETPKTNGVRFTAHYSGYHRFAVTSTILPTTPN